MADFEDVKELLATATLAGGADESVILAAETALDVRFSPSYRLFLSRCGAAICKGFEFAGLFHFENDDEPPLWSHVVTGTLQIRRASRGRILNEYVLISDDGGDYKFYLDTSRCNAEGECPVVVLGPGADAVIVAQDFFDFVSRSFTDRLSF